MTRGSCAQDSGQWEPRKAPEQRRSSIFAAGHDCFQPWPCHALAVQPRGRLWPLCALDFRLWDGAGTGAGLVGCRAGLGELAIAEPDSRLS